MECEQRMDEKPIVWVGTWERCALIVGWIGHCGGSERLLDRALRAIDETMKMVGSGQWGRDFMVLDPWRRAVS